MFTSYLLSAVRNLRRDKYYALINISGLAIAMGCCLIIGLYLRSELSYDRHNTQHERLYRVVNLLNNNGFVEDFSRIPPLVGPLMVRDFSEVEDSVRFQGLGSTAVRHDNINFYWDSIVFADPNVFDVFTHEIIAGNPDTALIDPGSIAISESFARSYFAEEDPIGQFLSTDSADYQVSLVFADLPENTHFKYDALLSFNRLGISSIYDLSAQQIENAMWNTSTWTYLLLPAEYDVADFDAVSDSFWNRYMAEQGSQFNASHRYYLEPLADIHLHSTTLADMPRGNKYFVYALIVVGLFLLVIASINYMNLATARYAKRAREVGLRKVLGSQRAHLVQQFLGESLVYAILAVPIAILLAEAVLAFTPMTSLLDTNISVFDSSSVAFLSLVPAAALLLGLLSGIYPAWFLSALTPLQAISGSKQDGKRSTLGRHLLVLLQFTISVGVIASALLMHSQMQYLYQKPLGFNKENKIIVRLRGADTIEQLPALRNTLLQNPQVLGVTYGSIPGIGQAGINAGPVENNDGSTESRVFNIYRAGEDYLDVMGM